MPAELNGGYNEVHMNETTKLKFDSIEDTITAFSMCYEILNMKIPFSQRVNM